MKQSEKRIHNFRKVGKGENKGIYGTIRASQTRTICWWYKYVLLDLKGLTITYKKYITQDNRHKKKNE